MQPFKTSLTELLKIDVPIMSAGMAGVAGPDLVAAVSNAGGIGTIGAIGLSPDELRDCIRHTRTMTSKPIGVDLLLPKVGGNARKTNKDYTGGQLNGLVDVMVEEKIELFVCAVGLPPKWVVDKMHQNGTIVMNMIGSPKHVSGCIKAGVDIVCAQGTEAGAHTGAITTMVLIPQVADALRGTGILLVGAGGIYDGRGVAASFALGCDGVWLGSRFIMTPEANVHPGYQETIKKSRSDDTIQSEIYTGRPMRHILNDYSKEWEFERQEEKRKLLSEGIIPFNHDAQNGRWGKKAPAGAVPSGSFQNMRVVENWNSQGVSGVAVGQSCGALNVVKPAKDVVEEIMMEMLSTMRGFSQRFSSL